MTEAEEQLRALWTRQGVEPEKQDALIAAIDAKAQPGTRVGPFTIGQPMTARDTLREWGLCCRGGAQNLLNVGGVLYSWTFEPRVQKNGALVGRVHRQTRGDYPHDIGSYKIEPDGRVSVLPAALRDVLPGAGSSVPPTQDEPTTEETTA